MSVHYSDSFDCCLSLVFADFDLAKMHCEYGNGTEREAETVISQNQPLTLFSS